MEDQDLFKELLFEKPTENFGRKKGEDSLIANSIEKFSSENNIGLLLPFDYSRTKREPGEYRKTMSASVLVGQNLERMQIEIVSTDGPLDGLDQDVLMSISTFATEQKTIEPIFSLSLIAKLLNLDKSMVTKIRKSVLKLVGTKITFRNSFFTSEGKVEREYVTHLISSVDFRTLKRDGISRGEGHRISLDPKVAKNLLNGFFTSLDKDLYLSLPMGAPRRIFQILETYKKNHGDIFIIRVEDLADILCLKAPKNWKFIITKYLNDIKDSGVELNFSFEEKQSNKFIKISYKGFPKKLIDDSQYIAFIDSITQFYGAKFLENLNFGPIEVRSLEGRLELSNETTFVDNFYIRKIFVLIDIVLMQYQKSSKPIKNLQALVTMISKDFAGPPYGYVYLDKRIDDRRKIEKIKLEKEKDIESSTFSLNQAMIERFKIDYAHFMDEIYGEVKEEQELFSDFNFTLDTLVNAKIASKIESLNLFSKLNNI